MTSCLKNCYNKTSKYIRYMVKILLGGDRDDFFYNVEKRKM